MSVLSKPLGFLLVLSQMFAVNALAGYEEVEYQSAEENAINPNFQKYLSGCGPTLIPYLEEFPKVEFLDNGSAIHLSSVKTKWQAVPGTFGELGGNVEISSKVERLIYFKGEQCTTRKVNNNPSSGKKTRLSYADKGLMKCVPAVMDVNALGFTVGNLTQRLVQEYPEKAIQDSLDSTQRADYIHRYDVLNQSGEVVGHIERKYREDRTYIVMSTTEIEYTRSEKSCKFKEL